MLLVKTTIKESPTHGIGLYADEFIHKGRIVWIFHRGFDQAIDPRALEDLSPIARHQILHYCFVSPVSKKVIVLADNTRFMNHSKSANIGDSEIIGIEHCSVALRDIQIGEELLEDYSGCDTSFPSKFNCCEQMERELSMVLI